MWILQWRQIFSFITGATNSTTGFFFYSRPASAVAKHYGGMSWGWPMTGVGPRTNKTFHPVINWLHSVKKSLWPDMNTLHGSWITQISEIWKIKQKNKKQNWMAFSAFLSGRHLYSWTALARITLNTTAQWCVANVALAQEASKFIRASKQQEASKLKLHFYHLVKVAASNRNDLPHRWFNQSPLVALGTLYQMDMWNKSRELLKHSVKVAPITVWYTRRLIFRLDKLLLTLNFPVSLCRQPLVNCFYQQVYFFLDHRHKACLRQTDLSFNNCN